MRCLVVDDSPTIQLLLRHLLAPHGECDVVQNGQEALDAHQRSLDEGRPYHLICLDLGLPYVHGADVLASMRTAEALQHPPVRSRIIVVTASRDTALVQRICEHGADGYLLKPIDADKLIEYLHRSGLGNNPDAEHPALQAVTRLAAADEISIAGLAALIGCCTKSITRQCARPAPRTYPE